ncbi:tetratricopeptide repeat protein 30 [Salpingoeca rosetta]|uniref:Tetratricopeptide repeat protein 30 n=1 Tax=Salpingoeca rosetta (strain ATCC 50818 / BSB-021) TaxID=946362 RepID=F2UGS4_SALR5|nr:tetratricopeptide repeat protein 30 [Salpingoeca rosetta]EGD75824.1 tetratricopeptide repeat protein 30 [Salpingoeca rosetta]|eukprot:XP_004991745.1 tetratricopeptide repeat protein 30 [Salpingoeca rosetta]
MATPRVADGKYTETIYGMIKEKQYQQAAKILQVQLHNHPNSQAALSLLAYCYFHMQDFYGAAECYERLSNEFPEYDCYRLYHAQALYKACLYDEAMDVVVKLDNPDLHTEIMKLQAAIAHGKEDLAAARSMVEQCPPDDVDTVVNEGCLLVAESRFEEAREKFQQAINLAGSYQPQLSYNIALCHYRLKQYAQALKHIADIIERGIREHPELSVGMATEGIEVRSVGNTKVLHDTALIEAFNLKAAIEYDLRNVDAACEALTDMPPRLDEELDAVSLHNQALMNMEDDPEAGFEKLQFLLQQNPCPPETFGNLLLLYCKYEHFDLAADVMAENSALTYKHLSRYLYEFLDATITRQASPEEAFRRFDDMAVKHTEKLRTLTRQVQEARQQSDDDAVKRHVNAYDDAIERYIPVLMAQAKIYWDMKNYVQVEKIFRKSVEFCNEHDVWKLNVAHVLFAQAKYKEAAEELMRKLEREEENSMYEDPDRKVYHLCIVNLVIGTLYCAKGNFQFGISRVIKSLEPYDKKLGWETWSYAKRCFLALTEGMAKQMITLPDPVSMDIVDFFDACEEHGRVIPTLDQLPLFSDEPIDLGRHTIAFEARYLKDLFQRVLRT